MRSCPPAASGAAPQPTWVAPLKRWQTRQAPPKRSKARQAALPPDALGALLPTAATAAAAASLLTALWLRGADGLGYGATAEAAADGGGDQQQDAAANTAPGEPPSSAGAIWAAAWQGFAPQQQPQAVREAQATASQLPDGHEGAAASQEGLQRSPVLLLEGIRAADRSRLLALCLAALEAQVAALPPGVGLLHGGAAWRQLSAALLALASLAAAAAWLGYVPAQLLQAAAKRLAAAEPPVLAAAGLEGAAAAVQQQAAAAAAAAEGSGGGEDSDGLGGAALDWYRLDEKLQLFSSVLRLLTCNSIEQRGGTPGLPSAGGSGARSIGGQQEAPADLGLADSGSSTLVRQQALLLLQQQQDAGPLRSVRGWRATASGAASETQLLSLAPTVLQDMAVTAGDAVAAAYLADAAAAGPSAMAAPQPPQQAPPPPQQLGLALISSGGSGAGAGTPLEAGWWPTYVHRQLDSTRALQRFCNAVLLRRWVHRQYLGVRDIYEDRLPLWAIAGGGRRLQARTAPMKRTPELGRLQGLQYAASLLLEGADLLMPLLRTLWRQATAAASWLLVRLVGQAAALVRRGLQQGGLGQQGDGGRKQRQPAQPARRDDAGQQPGGMGQPGDSLQP